MMDKHIYTAASLRLTTNIDRFRNTEGDFWPDLLAKIIVELDDVGHEAALLAIASTLSNCYLHDSKTLTPAEACRKSLAKRKREKERLESAF